MSKSRNMAYRRKGAKKRVNKATFKRLPKWAKTAVSRAARKGSRRYSSRRKRY